MGDGDVRVKVKEVGMAGSTLWKGPLGTVGEKNRRAKEEVCLQKPGKQRGLIKAEM